MRVEDNDVGSLGVRTILDLDVGSYQVLRGLEARVETPLSFARPGFAVRGGGGGSPGGFSTPKDVGEDDGFFYDAGGSYGSKNAGLASSGGGEGGGKRRDGGRPTTRSLAPHGLYGPHEPGTGICGGLIARGAQGQFPDRFCLKTCCGFTSHSTKSYLSKLKAGAFYVKENDTHGYCKLSLSAEAAKLAPEGLLEGRNNVPSWKAVIRQLEDQLVAGPPTTQRASADHAEGLMGFAARMLKTPYAPTPMLPPRHRQHDDMEDDDAEEEGNGEGGNDECVLTLLQRLEDSIGHLRGELGVCSPEARYLTLHGGLVSLGEDHNNLHQDVLMLANKVTASEDQAVSLRAEMHQVHMVVSSLGADVAHLVQARGNGMEVDALR